jgi:hypothetical protein
MEEEIEHMQEIAHRIAYFSVIEPKTNLQKILIFCSNAQTQM